MLPKLSPNQRGIRVIKAGSNADNPYSIFNAAALQRAMKLSPAAFKLWAYLNAHKNEYEFGLSSKDVCEVCAMSKPTYLKAFDALVEAGYLVQVELYPNLIGYLFVEQGFGGE